MSLHKQANVILLKLVKNKEVLSRNGGGKREKMNPIVILCFEKQYTTLEHDTFCYAHTWVGKILCLKVNQTTLKVFS